MGFFGAQATGISTRDDSRPRAQAARGLPTPQPEAPGSSRGASGCWECVVFLAFLVGSFVHGVAGFGAGIVAMGIVPVWLPVMEAVPIVAVFSLIICGGLAVQMRNCAPPAVPPHQHAPATARHPPLRGLRLLRLRAECTCGAAAQRWATRACAPCCSRSSLAAPWACRSAGCFSRRRIRAPHTHRGCNLGPSRGARPHLPPTRARAAPLRRTGAGCASR